MPDAVPKHLYHAEATALKGELFMPLKQVIDPQATASLHPKGGYLSQTTGEFRLESVISYTSAHTQVSGIECMKDCHAHATLSTAVVEGLNILEILTCDRVVAQVATEHPAKGHTPEIVFLGTRFENLRIAGRPLKVTLDIDTIGRRSRKDLHYLRDSRFLGRVAKQSKALRRHDALPQPARERYTGSTKVDGNFKSLEFSLVTDITGDFPGKAFGHVIHVPHFGNIDLATVKITCYDDKINPPKTTVELKMLEVNMGCIGHGNGDVAFAKTNGGKGP